MTLQLENYLVHDELTIADILKPDLPPGLPAGRSCRLQDWPLVGLKQAGANVIKLGQPALKPASCL